MTDRLAELLAALEQAVPTVPTSEAPAVLGRLETLRASLWGRLLVTPVPGATVEDRNLDIETAAARLGMSKRWLYQHARDLPFTKHIGRRVLFSEAGITRWLTTRPR